MRNKERSRLFLIHFEAERDQGHPASDSYLTDADTKIATINCIQSIENAFSFHSSLEQQWRARAFYISVCSWPFATVNCIVQTGWRTNHWSTIRSGIVNDPTNTKLAQKMSLLSKSAPNSPKIISLWHSISDTDGSQRTKLPIVTWSIYSIHFRPIDLWMKSQSHRFMWIVKFWHVPKLEIYRQSWMIRDTIITHCTRARYVSIIRCEQVLVQSTNGNSLMAYPAAPANATCLPSVGLFIYSYEQGHNYSEADVICTQQGAILADVLSESRTNYLSALVLQYSSNTTLNAVDYEISSNQSVPTSTPIRHAFVGLKEVERSGKFISSQLKPIECFRYRAWAPKFPRFFFCLTECYNQLNFKNW